MKALILFDGSKTSELCLKAACQDAFALNIAQAEKSGQNQPIEAMLLTAESDYFDDIVTNQVRIYKNRGQLLLDQGLKELECCGEFDTITGRLIQSNQANLTQVLIDQANAWQATTIYLAMDEQSLANNNSTPQKQPAWLSWLGFKSKPDNSWPGEFQVPAETPLTTSQVRVKQVLEQTHCRVVLINAAGVAMRLTYYPPATRPALQERMNEKAGKSKVA